MNSLELILVLLAAAVVAVISCRRLGLPPALGYLTVGVLVGPHALNMVGDVETARHLAEFGIVFLMFSIGLEFSLPKLVAMRHLVFGIGLLQVALTSAVVLVLVQIWGLSWQAGIALGGALAMSSTALLTKLLAERNELDAPHGKEIVGVLLFQDLAVVPLLIVLPSFSQSPEKMAGLISIALLKAAAVLASVLYLGPKLIRDWLFVIARRKSAELFMLNILLVTLGMAYLTELAGLSLALGAFVAGMLISETEYRYRVEQDIKPFQDVLMGLFFVTVGMLLDFSVVGNNLVAVVVILVLLLGGKFAVAAMASRLLGSTPGNSLRAGFWLCAAGEFGFVLLSEMRRLKLVPPDVLQPVLAAMVLSVLIAPLLIHYSERLVLRFARSEWLLKSMQLTRIAAQTMQSEKHVLICGFGRTGQLTSRLLTQDGIPHVALDIDPERVREATIAGENVVYGDATRRETLIAAGARRAAAAVVAFSDVHVAERVLAHLQELRPDLPVIARAADEVLMERLYKAGATEVVNEILESSLILSSHVLLFLGTSADEVTSRMSDTRCNRYQLLRGVFEGNLVSGGEGADESLKLRAVHLEQGAYGIGRSLAELGLDLHSISAIRRGGIRVVAPTEEVVLRDGDVVILLGRAGQLQAGEARLLKG